MSNPASTEMHAVLTAIEEALDGQVYPIIAPIDDVPDAMAIPVVITAGLWRQIGRALSAADRAEAA